MASAMNISDLELFGDFRSSMQAMVLSRHFATAVNTVALLVLTVAIASLTWKLIRSPVTAGLPQAAQAAVPAPPEFDLHALLAANLFGVAVTTGLDHSNAPVSSLNLVLTGIVEAGRDSYALISVNSTAQESFALGDEVSAGAVLVAVYADRVILVRAGVEESLVLEGMPSPIDVAIAAQGLVPGGAGLTSQIMHGSPKHSPGEHNRPPGPRREPQMLLGAGYLEPHAESGFLVREVLAGGTFEKLGLQVGDIVRAVNGRPLRSVNDTKRLHQQLRKMKAVQVEVTRGGQVETLQYAVN
jgi:type II secretion system protein C